MRRLFSPRWILVHVLLTVLVVLMVNLGFWQLRRLDEKRSFNARLTAASEMPVTELFRTDAWRNTAAPVEEWRRVVVEGTYDPHHAVTIVNRSQDGTAGYDTLVPLVLADARVVFVNRGFVPLATAVPAPPTGTVKVMGYVRTTQVRGSLGAVDSVDTNVTEFQRFDIELISRRLTAEHFPWYLQRVKEVPGQTGTWPATVTLPALDEGPHLSYAVQWFFFSTVAVVGWVVVVRRRLRGDVSAPSAPSGTSA